MLKSIKCYLIDDDEDDQEIFRLALKDLNSNIECIIEADYELALSKVINPENEVPNYIFIDMNMPRFNGLTCLDQIKSAAHLSEVPVFIYSTTSDPSVIAESKNKGATDFIVKPSSIPEFTEILKILFEDY